MQNKKVILIIDDDPDFRSSLKVTLESAGYRVMAAGSGAEGIKLFIESTPDLIICDIMMEKIDTGIRLVREIREKNKKVPLYLLSDIGRLTATNIDIFELGCNGTFQKPYDPDELLRVVKQNLDKQV
jgi:DNA-binding response OmpR family regulator